MGLPDPKATVVIPFLKGMVLPDAKATVVVPLRSSNGAVSAPGAGRNFLDAGEAPLRTYNEIEYAVQMAELVDSTISNAGAGAAAAVRYGPNMSRVTPLLKGVRAAGGKMAPVQAALWAMDAGRAVFDPEYRRESLEALSGRMDSYETSTFGKSFDTLLNVLSRPVSTGGAMIRYSMAEMNRQNELEAKGLELDERNNMQRQRNRNADRSKIMQDFIDAAEEKSPATTPELDKLADFSFDHRLANIGKNRKGR